MGKLLHFRGVTRLDLDPATMLDNIAADKPDLDAVIVLGFTKDGECYFASSKADGGDLMWLMEVAKHRLINTAEDERE